MISYTIEYDGRYGATTTAVITDTPTPLTTLPIAWVDDNGRRAIGLFITVEGGAIRFGFSTTPVPGSIGHLVYAQGNLFIRNPHSMRTMTFVADAPATPVTLQITPQYGF